MSQSPKRRRRLYLDPSVLGFSLNPRDPDRQKEANRLLRQVRQGRFRAGISYVTFAEIDAAPPALARKLHRKVAWAGLGTIRVRSRSAAHDLAMKYCRARAIPMEFFDDALHVAVATLWRAHALVSYNFTHLVRLDTMIQVNAINRREGLPELYLCQPSEVIWP